MKTADNDISRLTLPEPTLRRLPWYLAYISRLKRENVEFVSSTQIAKEINVDSSQIAKDLSFLSVKGKTRIGYEVANLERILTDFLGFKEKHNAFMIGVGSLGGALIQDSGLQQYGLNIVAGFDIKPSLIGKSITGIPVYDIATLAKQQSVYKASIAILAVPADVAQSVTNHIVEAGLKAIWNFTPSRINPGEDIVVQNTSIYAHLALMYNRMSENNK